MGSRVKTRRRYRSPARAEQSERTRLRIRTAAERLFLKHGYGGTSIDAIAAAARVSRPTVFNAFMSKANLLKEIITAHLWADPEALVALGSISEPVEIVRAYAKLVTGMTYRSMPMSKVMLEAAVTEPEIAKLVRKFDETRLSGVGSVVDVLQSRGVQTRWTGAEAKEAVWMLTGAPSYLLAESRGWSEELYERWLGDCMVALLLGDTEERPREI